MSSKSVVDAGGATKEERQERQCVSDVYIGIIFGGSELSLADSGQNVALGPDPSGSNMEYEQEFQKYKAKKLFVNGRLKFLEEYQDKQKTIDALGLYDTETSIGYLVKKDGTRWMCRC